MNFNFDESSKIIKRSESVNEPKKVNQPNTTNRINYAQSALSKKLEAFNYIHPSPEKEYPVNITNPAIDLPTKEFKEKSSTGLINFTAAEATDLGIQFPTADSDKATTIKDGKVESLRDPKSVSSLYENGLEFFPDINTAHIFPNLDTLIFYLPEHLDDLNYMTSLKEAFNNIFKSKCKEISFSNNIDNLFFGIRVYPIFSDGELKSFCDGNTNINEFTYNIEFDSKLWDPIVSLDSREMNALTIYAIYYSTNKNVLDNIVNNITHYQITNGVKLDLNSTGKCELLNYAISDSMMKSGSPFNKDITEVSSDRLMRLLSIQLHGAIEHGLRKLENNINYFKQDADNRFIILGWVLRILDDYEHLMLHAVHQIKKCIDVTGSLLERRMLLRIVNTIEKLEKMVNESYIEEEVKIKDHLPAYSISQSRDDLIDIKNNLTVATDIKSLSYVANCIISNIDAIQTVLSNPNLDNSERSEWDSILLDYLSVKDSLIESKDYLNHFGGSSIPVEYLSRDNNI